MKPVKPVMTEAAKMQLEKERAKNQELVHEFLKDIKFEFMLDAVLAHIEARPESSTKCDDLMGFANKAGRIAWKNL